MLKWIQSKSARSALFFVAMIESAVFPIPPDALLIPMVLKNKSKAFSIATIAVAGSICGALLGYLIGWGFFETLGSGLVQALKLETVLEAVKLKFSHNAFLTLILGTFTPIPFLLFTLTAGLFKVPLIVFILGATIGRAMRFYLEAGLLSLYGRKR